MVALSSAPAPAPRQRRWQRGWQDTVRKEVGEEAAAILFRLHPVASVCPGCSNCDQCTACAALYEAVRDLWNSELNMSYARVRSLLGNSETLWGAVKEAAKLKTCLPTQVQRPILSVTVPVTILPVPRDQGLLAPPPDLADAFVAEILTGSVVLNLNVCCQCNPKQKDTTYCAGCMAGYQALKDTFNERTGAKRSLMTTPLGDKVIWHSLKQVLGLTAPTELLTTTAAAAFDTMQATRTAREATLQQIHSDLQPLRCALADEALRHAAAREVVRERDERDKLSREKTLTLTKMRSWYSDFGEENLHEALEKCLQQCGYYDEDLAAGILYQM